MRVGVAAVALLAACGTGDGGAQQPGPHDVADLDAVDVLQGAADTGSSDVLAKDVSAPTGSIAITLHKLAACGVSPSNPLAEIDSMRLVVADKHGNPLPVDGKEAAFPFTAGTKKLAFDGIAAGSGHTVTLLGYVKQDATPRWFGRRDGVDVPQDKAVALDVTLMRLAGPNCVATGATPVVNVAFADATPIDRGRVLITGGLASSEKKGGARSLGSVRDDAYIFDAPTGELRRLVNQQRLWGKRAGHKAVFLPDTGKVLIVGGAAKMSVPADGKGPPSWNLVDGINVTFETLDLGKDASGKTKEAFHMPETTDFLDKVVLPNLLPLADDYVVVLGGAPWPAAKAANKISYKHSDLFDPNEGEHGRFVKVAGALPLNAVRAGAALAFIGMTSDGGRRYLVWGGNDTPGVIAEVFREDTQPGSGVFDAKYKIEGDILGKKGSLHFSTLTRLGADKGNSGRFLAVGGVRYHGGKWLAPDPDDVYLVTLHDTAGAPAKLVTKRLSGLGAGLYLHQATRTDSGHVLISGGFDAFDQASTFSLAVYDIAKGTFSQPPGADKFVKRGAHTAARLDNGCVLTWGGVPLWADLNGTSEVTSDIFCPSHLAQ